MLRQIKHGPKWHDISSLRVPFTAPEGKLLRRIFPRSHNSMMEKVRVSVECPNCRPKYDSQQRPERMVATRDEIDRAIDCLKPTELRKLQKWADRRVRGLGRASCGRNWEDLFHDAWLSTLIGRKKWNKSAVDFFGHMAAAIQNISFCWKQKFDEWEASLESEIITRNAEGDEISPLENVPSCEPSADQCLSAKEEVKRIFKRFRNDKEATAVLQGLLEGMKKNEIMQRHGLTETQYKAAVKRIRVKTVGPSTGKAT